GSLRHSAGALPGPRRRGARADRPRVERRDVPARGRPPRRGAVPRPRGRPDDLHDVGAVRAPREGRVPRADRRTAHVSALWCELAWLGGDAPAAGELVEIEGDAITSVRADAEPPPDCERLAGLTIPGLANAHSHAFQRA